MALSPLMKQYKEVKAQHPDCILMCRVGDFYEMFFEDAKIASRELELVLTGKDCGLEERAPMCGVPFHAADSYVSKLVSHGFRVAICEQMEDPADAKGLVKREVVRIISPGTVTDGNCLEAKSNNFLCAVWGDSQGCGVAFCDISTGEISATEMLGEGAEALLISESAAFSPKELVCAPSLSDGVKNEFRLRFGTLATTVEEDVFDLSSAREMIAEVFGQDAPETQQEYALCAVGGLLRFVKSTQKTDLCYFKQVDYYSCETFLGIDLSSRRNLEICESLRGKTKKGSLLWAIDRTSTGAGGRLLRRHLEHPLVNENAIRARLEAVKELYGDSVLRGEVVASLKGITDIERLTTRLVYGTANARDLKALEKTITLLPRIKDLISVCRSNSLKQLFLQLDPLTDIGETISDTIADEPSALLREGNIIKRGCNAMIDELWDMVNNGKAWIARIEEQEREKTGIKTLKVGYNRVFGYYIEVSKQNADMVPAEYIRRQTLTNGERYVTEELKDTESRVIGARDKLYALEYELFSALRNYVLSHLERIKTTASALAQLDVFCSHAQTAREQNFVCPEVDRSDKINIKNGRHPVVERFLEGNYFVPNDCSLDCGANRLMLITGPNMAGKSTFMRQVALIVLLAQIGSFVPATEARIGIVDRIFTRVGASDDLASGSSTFMLEMTEVADILKNATKNSLIIYDEIGRGTSTYDGMSIARAVVEYTAKKIGARTLFATHYHELTTLPQETEGVVNFNIAAKKRGNDIVFLRKIVKGAADDSYGIEVAHLAGVPAPVVKRAKEVLASLLAENGGAKRASCTPSEPQEENVSFSSISNDRVLEQLRQMDINTLTPYEAISFLYQLKKELD